MLGNSDNDDSPCERKVKQAEIQKFTKESSKGGVGKSGTLGRLSANKGESAEKACAKKVKKFSCQFFKR